MRYVVWMFCMALVFLIGCIPEEDAYIYVEVVIAEGSPPVFRISNDEDFGSPAYVYYLFVLSEEPGTMYWAIEASNPGKHTDFPRVSQIIYGVVPYGFQESEKALPLEDNSRYRVAASGPLTNEATIYFTNKPGRYFGRSR